MSEYLKLRQQWNQTGKPAKGQDASKSIKRSSIKSKSTKQKLVPLPLLLEVAQKVFNTWIRNRDKDKPCISGGGGPEQAGHYYPVGSYSGVRFDEMNVHGQSYQDNCFKYGNEKKYRVNMVARYGSTAAEMLDERARLSKFKKWSRDELEQIIKKYKI